MIDFLLEKNKNSFYRNGNLFSLTDPSEYLEQKIRTTLSIQLGEFFIDNSIGIPYIPDFDSTKNEYRDLLLSIIQVKIMQIEGIKKLINFETATDNRTRKLNISFTAGTINDGEIEFSKELSI